MDYTVSDFYSKFEEKLLVLAGEGGFSRGVNAVGILDYELDSSVKDRYICENFHAGMIAVSTFLYAKNNPYMIADAVKYLIEKECSALLIRNVFDLPIPDTILKYAQAKNFPIFLIKGNGVYFEDFVYEVRRRREQLESISEYEDEINLLLYGGIPVEEILQHTRNIAPSLKSSFFVAYAMPDAELGTDDYLKLLKEYKKSPLHMNTNKLIKLGNDLIFAFSSDRISKDYSNETFRQIASLFNDNGIKVARLGISPIHYYLREFRDAILEARHAAICKIPTSNNYVLYDTLGVYKLLLQHCNEKDFVQYSNNILNPIRDYDTENGAALFETLLAYVKNENNIKKTAQSLLQHENTIRYRLEKIQMVCGLNYHIASEAEQLSIATKIHMAQEFMMKTFDKTS